MLSKRGPAMIRLRAGSGPNPASPARVPAVNSRGRRLSAAAPGIRDVGPGRRSLPDRLLSARGTGGDHARTHERVHAGRRGAGQSRRVLLLQLCGDADSGGPARRSLGAAARAYRRRGSRGRRHPAVCARTGLRCSEPGPPVDRRLGRRRFRCHAQARRPLVRADALCHALRPRSGLRRSRRSFGRRAAAAAGRRLRLAQGDGRRRRARGAARRGHLDRGTRRPCRARLRQLRADAAGPSRAGSAQHQTNTCPPQCLAGVPDLRRGFGADTHLRRPVGRAVSEHALRAQHLAGLHDHLAAARLLGGGGAVRGSALRPPAPAQAAVRPGRRARHQQDGAARCCCRACPCLC